MYLRARVYDPSTAQFLNADPLVAVTREPYTYALGNPLNFADPTGLCGFLNVICYAEEGVKEVAKGVETVAHGVAALKRERTLSQTITDRSSEPN